MRSLRDLCWWGFWIPFDMDILWWHHHSDVIRPTHSCCYTVWKKVWARLALFIPIICLQKFSQICHANAASTYHFTTFNLLAFNVNKSFFIYINLNHSDTVELLTLVHNTAIVGWISGLARLQTNKPFTTIKWKWSASSLLIGTPLVPRINHRLHNHICPLRCRPLLQFKWQCYHRSCPLYFTARYNSSADRLFHWDDTSTWLGH